MTGTDLAALLNRLDHPGRSHDLTALCADAARALRAMDIERKEAAQQMETAHAAIAAALAAMKPRRRYEGDAVRMRQVEAAYLDGTKRGGTHKAGVAAVVATLGVSRTQGYRLVAQLHGQAKDL